MNQYTSIDAVSTEDSGVSARYRGLVLVFLATLPTLAIAALVPILPLLFEHFHGEQRAQWLVPMILTMPSLCVALFSSLIGALADRFGRRRLLLISLVAFALFGLGPFLVGDLHALIATRFIVGLGEAGILTCGNALLGDYFEGEERQRWLAVQTMVGPFASVAYVLLGGALGGWSWRGPFLLYLVGLLVFIPSLWLLPEPRRIKSADEQQGWAGFPWITALQVGLVTLVCSVVFFVQNVQHGRIFSDLGASSPQLISWVITAAGLTTALGGVAYKYWHGLSIGKLLAIIFAIYGVGYGALALVPNYWIGIPFDALGQFAGGLVIPGLIAWTLSRYPLEYRGRGMGLWAACFFLGQFLSPPVVTLVGHGRWSFLTSVGVIGAACIGIAAGALIVAGRAKSSAAAGLHDSLESAKF